MNPLDTPRAARRRSRLLLSALFALFLALPAAALSNRIFVSSNGNDANDCANPLTPCLTFAGALAQVRTGGEVIAEATGGYGALNITQSVTISGPPGVVIYSGLPVNVNAPGATVVLRGLTIDGAGSNATGISVVAVGVLHIEGCVIRRFDSGVIVSVTGNADIRLDDTTIRDNHHAIILFPNSGGATRANVNRCRIVENVGGLEIQGAAVAVRDTEIAYNSGSGLAAFAGNVWIENCLVTHNGIGIMGTPEAIIRLSNSTVTNNATGLYTNAIGEIFSRGNNTVIDNTVNTTLPISTYSPF